MSPEIRRLKDAQIDERLDQSIREGLCICFPPDKEVFSKSRAWHGTLPSWTLLIEDNSQIIAHIGIVERKIRVTNEQISIAGLQNLFVLPAHRGKGFSPKMMKASMKEAGNLGHDFGLLFCVPQLEKLYALSKWKSLPSRRITHINKAGQEIDLPSKTVTMYYPLARSEFPEGDIHLQGSDW